MSNRTYIQKTEQAAPELIVEKRDEIQANLAALWETIMDSDLDEETKVQANEQMAQIMTASTYMLAGTGALNHALQGMRSEVAELQMQLQFTSQEVMNAERRSIETTLKHVVRQISIETGMTEIQVAYFLDAAMGEGLVDYTRYARERIREIIEDVAWEGTEWEGDDDAE
jgi:hypothetical protein